MKGEDENERRRKTVMALVFNELCGADVKFKAPHSMKEEIAKAANAENVPASEWLRTIVAEALGRNEFTGTIVTSGNAGGMAHNRAQLMAQELTDLKWPPIVWPE